MTWTTIACPPAATRRLIANLRVCKELRLWGDGGPAPITRALYQALNRTLHCGPFLESKRQMPSHMALRELTIKLQLEHADASKPRAGTSDESESDDPEYKVQHRDMSFKQLSGLVSALISSGLLSGYVEHIKVLYGSEVSHFDVQQVEGATVPSHWNRCGFEWMGA